MDLLKTYSFSTWSNSFTREQQYEMTHSLEDGQLLFFPALSFHLNSHEKSLLSPALVSARSKNISFNPVTNTLKGTVKKISPDNALALTTLLARYAKTARELVDALFPFYKDNLVVGRTSLRVVEIKDRVSSYRKDDKRLHVDAFPANPNHGQRILRVFSNINEVAPRVWHLGEPFETVVQKFLKRLPKPKWGSAKLLYWLKMTKKYRSLYDHYMLHMHDMMKGDSEYQMNAIQQKIHFPAGSSWIVQTDHVSHAALSGQHLLEQTFYLPVTSMLDEQKSPLRILEGFLKKSLVKTIR